MVKNNFLNEINLWYDQDDAAIMSAILFLNIFIACLYNFYITISAMKAILLKATEALL